MSAISLPESALPSQDKANNKHADAILKLAAELGMPAEEVKGSYEQALEQFKYAAIKDYVPIFVSRQVKEKLKQVHAKEMNVSPERFREHGTRI